MTATNESSNDPYTLTERATKSAEAAEAEIKRLQRRIRWNEGEQKILQEPLDSFRTYVQEKMLGKPDQRWPRLVTEGIGAWSSYMIGGAGAALLAAGTIAATKAAGAAAMIDPLGGDEWRIKNTELARRLATQLRIQNEALRILSDDVVSNIEDSKAKDGQPHADLALGASMLTETIEETDRLVHVSGRFLGIWTPIDAMKGRGDANEFLEQELDQRQ